jgi:hypothetical protein
MPAAAAAAKRLTCAVLLRLFCLQIGSIQAGAWPLRGQGSNHLGQHPIPSTMHW